MSDDNINTVTAGFMAGTMAVNLAILQTLIKAKVIESQDFLKILDQVEKAGTEGEPDKYFSQYISSVRKVVSDE